MAPSFVPHAASTGKRMVNPSSGLGRVCLVTGAGSKKGFGRMASVLFARHGARVIVTDLPAFEEGGRKVVSEIEAEGEGKAAWFPLDVTDERQWKEAIAFAERTFGPLDVLVNNAGIAAEFSNHMAAEAGPASISSYPTADWRRMVAVNMDGVFFGIREGAGSMERNPAPEPKSIINVSSGAAFIGLTGFGYTATKWAVRGMTKHAALFLAHKGIRCTSIHPGMVPTDIIEAPLESDEFRQKWIAAHPVGRLGDPIEVANLMLYLASTESSFTTGSEHIVDGGFFTTAGFLPNPFAPKAPKM
ncbi:short-chain dehydrogenase/reductase SDR [Hyaloraphidium curvatum]|nr:short-chain dehydrogenase/reductase SDR [Hyaloraphidium curvatum]